MAWSEPPSAPGFRAVHTPLFKVEDLPEIHAAMRFARLATLVTHGAEGLLGTPLPVVLEAGEGPYGTLYCHVAKANPVWRDAASAGEAMAIFMGPDTYVTPSWYATKALTHKVVPTWNYVAVHAYGPIETFDDPERLHAHVSALTRQFEAERAEPWAVTERPIRSCNRSSRGSWGSACRSPGSMPSAR